MKLSSKKKPPKNIRHTERWEKRYQELVEFKHEYGHCNVPAHWSKNTKLSRWVNNQRILHNTGKLSQKRFQRLRKIGFQFYPRKADWDRMIDSLAEFKKTQGHCNVPEKRIGNSKLARWVKDQRVKWKQGKLPEEHFQKLNRLGFVWQRHDAAWEDMYNRLVRFRNKWGHCKVPYNWSADRQLSKWVYTQRTRRNRGLLNKERIIRLDKIGFEWSQK